MNRLFLGCKKLKKLPDISKWNTSNIIEMKYLFGECSDLITLPDISKWKIKKVYLIKGLFLKCSSLTELPDISKWDTSEVISLEFLFFGCSALKSLPDISKWNVNKVIRLCDLFFNCSSLESLPDISKWNIFDGSQENLSNYKSHIDYFYNEENRDVDASEIINQTSFIHYDCNDIYLEKYNFEIPKVEPNFMNKGQIIDGIMKFETYSMKNLFCGCSSLEYLPDISNWKLENVKSIENMFRGCTSLRELTRYFQMEYKKCFIYGFFVL